MNASPVAADTCTNCGVELPPSARFCPACGVQAGAGSVTVSLQRTEPHWFGVTPPQLLLAIAALTFVVALTLFATGHWPYGLILLGVATLLLAGFLEAARRRPESSVTRASVDARERARSSWETLRARQTAAAESRRIQNALLLLESDRRSALQELGAAAHAQDSSAEAPVRARLAELDAHETQLRAELDEALGEADERIRKARLPVQETMLVLPSEPGPAGADPAPPGEDSESPSPS
jgi:hypothetical protein